MTQKTHKTPKNMTNNSTDTNEVSNTPRTDACPHCGALLLTHHTQAYCEERTARKKAEAEVESLNSRMVELKHKQASLLAAVNWAISEYPSDRACQYLNPIIEKLFSK
jgi:predicted  nucleic acid-binding Zn-ribbon protein